MRIRIKKGGYCFADWAPPCVFISVIDLGVMELRKDPITRSWVIVGEEEGRRGADQHCPFCPGSPNQPQVISTLAPTEHGAGPVLPWCIRRRCIALKENH